MKGGTMADLIDRQELRKVMYHEAFETDSDEQMWDSGCWVRYRLLERILNSMPSAQPQWIPCSERLPIKEFEEGRKNRTVYDILPCLVTRYSTHTDEPRTRTYVCKSYFDGEDFMLHGGYAPDEESDTENTIAWMPLPEPYREEANDATN